MSDDKSIDEIVEGFTQRQIQVAFQRALRALSIPYELSHDGSVASADHRELLDSDEFEHEFGVQLKMMAIDQVLEELIADGIVEKIWLDDTNQIGYRLKNVP